MAIYMKYADIKGTVSASGHEQWIELSSFKYDITRAISAQTGAKGDRETSAPTVGEVVITKRTDRSTVGLLGEAYQGHGKKVLFGKWSGSEVKIDGEDLMIMKESDVMGVIEGKPKSAKKVA
jgi:co-chaperonin GroES (HSP10)